MLRQARRDEVAQLVQMLADDQLGAAREQVSDVLPYLAAFDAIAADTNNSLWVWEENGAVVGCLQLTFIPGLSNQGAWRAQIEGVRVVRAQRGQGIGGKMMAAAIERARTRGCATMQLTSNKVRADAHRFYEQLGFVASHEGMKLKL